MALRRSLWPGCLNSPGNVDAQEGRQRELLQENAAFGLGLELPLWPHPGDSLYIRWHLDNLESLKGFSTSCSRLCLRPTFWLTTPVFLPRKPTLSMHVADPIPPCLAPGPTDPPLQRRESETLTGMRDRFRALGGPGVALLLPQQRASPARCVCQSKAKHKVRSEAVNWRWQKARGLEFHQA